MLRSNWKTASAQYLDPLDKYANAVADFYDRHGYFGGLHQGPNSAWNIEVNQTYDDRSALKFRFADGGTEDFSNRASPEYPLLSHREIGREPPPFRPSAGALHRRYASLSIKSRSWFGIPRNVEHDTASGPFVAGKIYGDVAGGLGWLCGAECNNALPAIRASNDKFEFLMGARRVGGRDPVDLIVAEPDHDGAGYIHRDRQARFQFDFPGLIKHHLNQLEFIVPDSLERSRIGKDP